MTDGPFKDFIDKLPAERKPLSEKEKEEARVVGVKLRKKASRYLGEGTKARFRVFENDRSLMIIADPRYGFDRELLQRPTTADLVIVLNRPRDSVGTFSPQFEDSDMYEFSGEEIIKTESSDVALNGAYDFEEIGDKVKKIPIMGKEAEKLRNQEKRIVYEPNKWELRGLLYKLTLSKPLVDFS